MNATDWTQVASSFNRFLGNKHKLFITLPFRSISALFAVIAFVDNGVTLKQDSPRASGGYLARCLTTERKNAWVRSSPIGYIIQTLKPSFSNTLNTMNACDKLLGFHVDPFCCSCVSFLGKNSLPCQLGALRLAPYNIAASFCVRRLRSKKNKRRKIASSHDQLFRCWDEEGSQVADIAASSVIP